MTNNFMSKDQLFYDSYITRSVEQKLVECLEEEAVEGRFNWPCDDWSALQIVRRKVADEFQMKLSPSACEIRVQLLFERLQIFYYLIGCPVVTWIRSSNRMRAREHFWEWVTKEAPLASAYIVEGEQHYLALLSIFGTPSQRAHPPRANSFVIGTHGLGYVMPSSQYEASPGGSASIVEINSEQFENSTHKGFHNKYARRVRVAEANDTSPAPGQDECSDSVNSSPSQFINLFPRKLGFN